MHSLLVASLQLFTYGNAIRLKGISVSNSSQNRSVNVSSGGSETSLAKPFNPFSVFFDRRRRRRKISDVSGGAPAPPPGGDPAPPPEEAHDDHAAPAPAPQHDNAAIITAMYWGPMFWEDPIRVPRIAPAVVVVFNKAVVLSGCIDDQGASVPGTECPHLHVTNSNALIPDAILEYDVASSTSTNLLFSNPVYTVVNNDILSVEANAITVGETATLVNADDPSVNVNVEHEGGLARSVAYLVTTCLRDTGTGRNCYCFNSRSRPDTLFPTQCQVVAGSGGCSFTAEQMLKATDSGMFAGMSADYYGNNAGACGPGGMTGTRTSLNYIQDIASCPSVSETCLDPDTL